jgi:hypothetical protein
VKVSLVRETLLSRILETISRRGINMIQIVGELKFVIVGNPGGASMEELLSWLPEDVIGSGLNKEDPGRTPHFCIPVDREGMSVGADSEECMKQICVLSLKQ